jgi:hypothetical protein
MAVAGEVGEAAAQIFGMTVMVKIAGAAVEVLGETAKVVGVAAEIVARPAVWAAVESHAAGRSPG